MNRAFGLGWHLMIQLSVLIIITPFQISALDYVEIDIAYEDASGDVSADGGQSTTDKLPGIDVISIESEEDGIGNVTAVMYLGAPIKQDAAYYFYIDTNDDTLNEGRYSNGSGSIHYSNGHTSTRGIYNESDRIVWVFDRMMLGDHETFDIHSECFWTDWEAYYAWDEEEHQSGDEGFFTYADYCNIEGTPDGGNDGASLFTQTVTHEESPCQNPMDPYSGATPTDTSLSVVIEEFHWRRGESGNNITFNFSAVGTTEGDVHHCSFALVFRYLNGSVCAGNFTIGPYNTTYEISKPTMEYYSYSSSDFSGIDDEWNEWSLDSRYQKDSPGNHSKSILNISEIVLYIRAYGDPSDAYWNQASYHGFITENDTNGEEGNAEIDDAGDDETSRPIFLWVLVTASFLVMGYILITRKKGK